MTDAAASPLRVGLFGLGRSGLYLIEHFAAGGPFRIVAAWADPIVGEVVSPFGVRLVNDPQELLAASDVDVIWFADHDSIGNDVALPDVLSTKHTILETPIGLTPAVLDRSFSSALKRGRQLLVRHPRRWDSEYCQALSVAQDQSSGSIRSAKLTSWTYAIPPRGATRESGPLPRDVSDNAQVANVRFAAHALDQLVLLIGDRPLRVFANGDTNACEFPDLFAGFSLSLQIHFERGCRAEIDIRLDSPTQFQSGWMLTAERGGYSNGRRFTLTEEGEVFDSPVPLAIEDKAASEFESLAQQIRSGGRDLAEEARVRTVVALLDAAQRSIESQQAVDL